MPNPAGVPYVYSGVMNRIVAHLGVLLLTAGLAVATCAPAVASADSSHADGFLRGMTVSCPTWGPIWGSPAMADSLDELSDLGVEWVAIHPYARVGRDGTLRFRPAQDLDFLTRAVELVEARGMKLFWKPHLAYWGSFEWRGTIEFGDDEAAWRRFFEAYRAFIVDQARFAARHRVPVFAVGVELEATTHREREWREILAAVRRVYPGRVVYAANWDRLDRVPFWDAVDSIGVQAYFPLSSQASPSRETLMSAWETHLRQLERLASQHSKPVLLTEIGYARSVTAATEPWSNHTESSAAARSARTRLLEVALERLPREPWIEGMFWWKWIPGSTTRDDRDFSMKDPEARDVLRRYWAPSASTSKGA